MKYASFIDNVLVCPKHGVALVDNCNYGIKEIDGNKYFYFVKRCPICNKRYEYYTNFDFKHIKKLNESVQTSFFDMML